MTKAFEPSAPQIPLKFGSSGGRRRTWDSEADDFGIYSCRFSADGNEVVAGGNGRNGGELRGIYFCLLLILFLSRYSHPVYDLLTERRTITIDAHDNDVNSCCWADTSSGNILIRYILSISTVLSLKEYHSASDDSFIKVW